MNLKFLKIMSSSGEYTLRTNIDGFRADIPFGTSKSKYEAKGVNFSKIKDIERKIKPKLKSHSFTDLNSILEFEKYTKNLGVEVCLGVSYSLIRKLAHEKNTEVWKLFTKRKSPVKVVSKILGGGAHFPRGPTIQEFLYASKASTLRKRLENNLKVYYDARKELLSKDILIGMDLEGGLVPRLDNNGSLDVMKKYKHIGIDFAATDKYKNRNKQMGYMKEIIRKYNLFFVEDPLDEDDFEGFAALTEEFGKKHIIVGDDLLSTCPERLEKAINLKACNGCIVKPDQIGNLSQTIEFVKKSKRHNIVPVISHRSNETNDVMISDLAVGLSIPMMKISIINGERITKLNRLLEIEEQE